MDEGGGGFDWIEEYDGQLQVHSVAGKRKNRSRATRKLEFVGWGSRPLIEFLQSIGTDTAKPISQYDVTAILNKYVNDHSLLHPTRKKRVVCDQSLLPLFGKKTISRIRIYDLLNAHFAENQLHSDDFFDTSDEDEPQHRSTSERKTQLYKKPPEEVPQPPKSCFAAIIPNNIKLVYLKRSLIQDLLKEKDKDPQMFERKLVGSFVRIKSDPNDYLQKNSHMLVQVIGLKKASGTDDKNADILFEVTNFIKDVQTSMLSDDNFSEACDFRGARISLHLKYLRDYNATPLFEDECEDLRRRITEGLFKRPTIVQLEEKVEVLHEDITKHWLSGELLMLQKLIDRANEKGWRKEYPSMIPIRCVPQLRATLYLVYDALYVSLSDEKLLLASGEGTMSEYLERRQLLQTADEQKRRLLEVPKIIADEIEVKATTLDLPVIMNQEDDISPKSTLSEASEIPFCDTAAKKTSSTWIAFGTKSAGIQPALVAPKQTNGIRIQATLVTSKQTNGIDCGDARIKEQQKHPTSIQSKSSGRPPAAEIEEKKLSQVVIEPPVLDSRNDALVREQQKQHPTSIQSRMSSNGGMPPAGTEENKRSQGMMDAAAVIDLSDDEEDEDPVQILEYDPGSNIWHYVDPQGDVQGPFSITSLKRWKDNAYFPPDFKVWRMGQKPEEAVFLNDILDKLYLN